MPGSTETHHDEFRRLVGPIVADRKARFPESGGDWLAECYASAAAFEQRFPTRDEQEAVVAGFRQVDEMLREPLSGAEEAALSAGPPRIPEEAPAPRQAQNGSGRTTPYVSKAKD